MGGGPSHAELANPNAGKPFFFLASCPESCLVEAVEVVQRYGGFRCVGEGTGSSLSSRAPFAAWKVKAEAQFMTLKQLSPVGQKVFGIAIAGFGPCNDEREFLGQLHKKHGYEQFTLKQCGDVDDMERWLQSQGYVPVPGGLSSRREEKQLGLAGAPPGQYPVESRATPGQHPMDSSRVPGSFAVKERGRPQESQLQVWASVFGGSQVESPQRAAQERLLGDVQRALEESSEWMEVDESNLDALRQAQEKLTLAIKHAADAGVIGDDLHEAEVQVQEISRLITAAEKSRKYRCWSCCCCCCHPGARATIEETATLVVADGESFATRPVEDEIRRKQADGGCPLRPGTKCRYLSASQKNWMLTTILRFNPEDTTYDLVHGSQVRKHANVTSISPDPNVTASQAWPPGTPVEYESSSANSYIPAVIRSFNGVAGTYNLDVRESASVDRIRLRLVST